VFAVGAMLGGFLGGAVFARMKRFIPYLPAGTLFGFTLVKSEAASWYRIMEMFHFQSFHMYGIMMSAIVAGIIGLCP